MALNRIKKPLNASRASVIDQIEEFYNDDWELVESLLTSVSGKSMDHMPDDDEEEGFYANFSTDELEEVLRRLTEPGEEYSLPLTREEKRLLVDITLQWSQPSFSKNKRESVIAKNILRKLDRM